MLAVWCLGCSSFDLLIDRMAGGDGGPDSCMAAAVSGGGPSVGAIAHRSQICACDHCVAIRGAPSAIDPVLAPTPQTIVRIVESPASIVRAPLHPPPVA
jgi:hypothetical protein